MLSGVPVLDAKIGPVDGIGGFLAIISESATICAKRARVSGASASCPASNNFRARAACFCAVMTLS